MKRALKRRYGHTAADPLAGTPELTLFHKWVRLRKKAYKDRRYTAAMDKTQYALQDMSPLGHSLVWGHEGRRRGI